jgi:hypothetical protein
MYRRGGLTGGERRGGAIQSFGGDQPGREGEKLEKKSCLIKKLFSWPVYIIIQNPPYTPSNNPFRRGSRGGAAQSIKAVPLDRQPAPPWCCSLLDGYF